MQNVTVNVVDVTMKRIDDKNVHAYKDHAAVYAICHADGTPFYIGRTFNLCTAHERNIINEPNNPIVADRITEGSYLALLYSEENDGTYEQIMRVDLAIRRLVYQYGEPEYLMSRSLREKVWSKIPHAVRMESFYKNKAKREEARRERHEAYLARHADGV